MRAVVLLSAVALLSVAAGCNTFPGADRPSDPVTPVGTPQDRPEDYAFPPGVAANGSVDTERLVTAHREEAAAVSHTMTYRVVVERGTGEDRTTSLDWNRTVRYETTSVYRSHVRYESVDLENGAARNAVYANGSVEFARSARAGERRYTAGVPSDRPPAVRLVMTAIDRYLPEENAAVERVVRDRQGYTVVRANAFGRNASGVSNESVEAWIRPSGLVETLSVSFTERDPGTERRSNVTVRIEYAAIGETSVTRPDWLPEARAEIDRQSPVVITEFVVTTSAPANTTTSTPTPAATPESPADE